MAMRLMDIEEIELFLTNIVREAQNIVQVLPKKRRMIDLYGTVQVKSVRGLHRCLLDPFFDAILYGEGRFAIGEDDVVPSLLQTFAQVQDRICWACPFPIAKKLKDLHRKSGGSPPTLRKKWSIGEMEYWSIGNKSN